MKPKILFVEPPKDYWFIMGEYLPPPTGLLILAAYLEREVPGIDIEIIDCQAERMNWKDLEEAMEESSPDFVAASGFTCNAYACARVAEIAKGINRDIVTIIGGIHFSFVPEESLLDFPEIDFIVRGEGEVTLTELVMTLVKGLDCVDTRAVGRSKDISKTKGIEGVKGISFRRGGNVVHKPPRTLLENLDALPYPAYHLVEDHLKKYHFTMMAGKKARYMVMEGSRGCAHRCSFCTQWNHWGGTYRTKSPKRIIDEMEFLYNEYGGRFIWLTDDNIDYSRRGKALYQELKGRDFSKDVMLFFQARTDDVARNPEIVGKLRSVGNYWVMLGVENQSEDRLKEYRKGIKVPDAYKAVKVLNKNDIFSHGMFVIGSRKDTHESIEGLSKFSKDIGCDFAIYTVLTPFPGTVYFEEARRNGWIEDPNYAHYDMAHAIMPTETLTRKEVQREFYMCYKSFYGSLTKNISGVFSKKKLRRNLYRHMAKQLVLTKLRRLI